MRYIPSGVSNYLLPLMAACAAISKRGKLLIYKLNGCSVYNYFCGTLHNRRRRIADINDCVCT